MSYIYRYLNFGYLRCTNNRFITKKNMTFKELGLNEKLLEGLSYMGFEEATPIQEQAIPKIIEGKDLLACAQTGTGKTAAFILPVLNQLTGKSGDKIKALVVCPTRELALQIERQIQAFSYFVDLASIAVYGGGDGHDFETQKRALSKGTEIIVATPGKLISHLNMGYVDFSELEYFILDEADRMLDMGFYDDIQQIASHVKNKKQTLLFSATMPPKIRKLSESILIDPDSISIAISKPAKGVLQAAYLTYDRQKAPLIRGLIAEKPAYESIIIFTSTKKKVGEIVRALQGNGYKVQAVSSDLVQKDREDALKRFRSKETRVIVATDVLSRGIDIKGINLVINYDVPGDAEDYIHRIGRTARADSTGVALTLVNEEDMYKFHRIEQLIESEVNKAPLPPKLGEGPKWDPKPSYGGGGRGRGKGGGRGNNRGRSSSNKGKSRSGGSRGKGGSSRGGRNSNNKSKGGPSNNSGRNKR